MSQSRREFLRQTGTLSLVGVTGCLGAQIDGPEYHPNTERTLIATWRGRDPTSTITLQWLAGFQDRPESASVTLSPKSEHGIAKQVQTTIAPFGDDLYRERAVLTGLSPDTTYDISIDGTKTDFTAKTAPQTVTGPLRFAEGGDIGTSAAVPKLHTHASNWDPLFAVIGGDLAYANGQDSQRWIHFLKLWHQHMRSGDRLIPIVAAIGNHEVKSGLHGSPDEAPFFYTLFDNAQRDRAYWAFDIGDYLSILILDSNHTTEVPGTQTDWLSDALSERRDQSHLLAAYHIPAYPSAKPIEARDRADIRHNWVPSFEEYNVDGVFEHDDHTYKRTHLLSGGEPVAKNGVRYVGDGAWGKGPRNAKSSAKRSYLQKSASRRHVFRVTLSQEGRQRIQAKGLNGEIFDGFEL